MYIEVGVMDLSRDNAQSITLGKAVMRAIYLEEYDEDHKTAY